MATNIGDLNVSIGADIAAFQAGVAQVQADLGKVAAAAEASSGRYTDASGKLREANGRFVSSAALAAEAAGKLGGSIGTLADVSGRAGSTINGGLASSFAAFDKAVKPLNDGIGRFSEGLKSAGTSLTTYLTLPLTLGAGAAVKLAGDMQVAKVAFTTMLGSAQAATDTLNDLKQFAADTPFEFPEIQEAAKKLLAFNTPANELKGTLRQLGDISAGIGAPIGEIADLFGKARVQGRLFQEDINQLTGRGIPIIQELAKQFNVTEDGVRKLVESGKVNFSNLQTAFADLTKEGGKFGGLMQAQSQTIPGLFSTLADNAGQALARLGQDIADTLDLKTVITGLADFVKRAADAFNGLSASTKSFLIVGAGIAAAVGPILGIIGSIGLAIPAVTAGFSALGISSLAALAPILPVAAAVAAAAYLIISNWEAVTAYFGAGGEGGRIFAELADSVGAAVQAIGGAFARLKAAAGADSFAGLVSASGIAKAIFRDLANGISAIADTVANTVNFISDLLSGEFAKAFADAGANVESLSRPLRNLFGLVEQRGATIGTFFKAQFDAVRKAAELAAAAESAALEGALQGGDLGGKVQQVGLLLELENKLKAAKDAKPNDTTEAEVAASNRLIASLEAQIKRLNELGIGSKKAQEALAKLRAELAGLSTLDDVLARPAEGLGAVERRIATLNAGLKNLLTAGISPASAAFRAFATESLTLQQGLAKLKADSQLDFKVTSEVKLKYTFGDTVDEVFRKTLSPELAARPLEIPFTLKPLNNSFEKNFDTLAIQKGFQDASNSAIVFGSAFDEAGARTDILRSALQKLLTEGVNPLDPGLQKVAAQLKAETDLKNINTAATEALTNGLANLGTGLLEGLGQLAAGTITLEAFGASILGLVGKLAVQLGEAIVAVGIGMLGLKTAFTNPFGAIAAGAALILIGSALGAIASSAANSGGGGGGAAAAGSGVSSAPRTNFTSVAAKQEGNKVIDNHTVTFEIAGSKLVGVLDTAQNRNARIQGSRV